MLHERMGTSEPQSRTGAFATSVTREILARRLHLWAGGAGARQFHQLGEVVPRLVAVAGLRRRLPRTVQAAVAVGVVHLRSLIFGERLTRSAALEQHVTEEFARGHNAPRAYRGLLARVLQVGCSAHEVERLLAIPLRIGHPRRTAQAL